MKYYIYALINPFTNQPFYVGKGTGDRWQSHLLETTSTTHNPHKFHTIAQIRGDGGEPTVEFWYFTNDEIHAYEIEVQYIKQYGRKGKDINGILTNLCIESIPPSKLGVKEKLSTRLKKSASAIQRFKTNPKLPPSIETRQKISDAKRGISNEKLKGKPSPHGKDELMRRAKKGHVTAAAQLLQIRANPEQYKLWLDERCRRATLARKAKEGIPMSSESKSKISLALKGKPKPILQCPHCKKRGGAPQMKRHHFDNCKMNPQQAVQEHTGHLRQPS